MWGVGCGVWGFERRGLKCGLGVSVRFSVYGLEFRAQGLRSRVEGLRVRI